MSALRVAVVDDARFIREALVRLLERESRLRVVGTAQTGEELLEHLDEWRPDVITLDLMMPGMGGMATLDRIMETRPTPVIILSTSSGEGAPQTVEALHRGAVDFIDKEAYSLVDFEALRAVLVRKIMGVAGAHLPEGAPTPATARPTRPKTPTSPPSETTATRFDLIAIGASTGGPKAVERVLTDLAPTIPVPVVIVQHMPAGFTTAFAQRLDRALPFPVNETSDGERLQAGRVYVAAAGRHLALRRVDDSLAVGRPEFPDPSPHCPSVDGLFLSALEAAGERVLAVLLTGMGNDGAHGLLALRRAGAYTIAQDEATSVVWGMPKVAVEAGAAAECLPISSIGGAISRLLFTPGSRRQSA